jgi:hypothetical protein
MHTKFRKDWFRQSKTHTDSKMISQDHFIFFRIRKVGYYKAYASDDSYCPDFGCVSIEGVWISEWIF